MSLTVVGSIALDTVETPLGKAEEILGGAAVFFSLAAAHFCRVNLIGVVGKDFPEEHAQLLSSRNINMDGLERADGKTFRWSARYHDDINERDTLDTQLNVLESFQPKLTQTSTEAPYLFLANIHPSLQLDVLNQSKPVFVGLDSMNLWIDIAPDMLKQVLKKIDCLVINDAEARQLTGENNLPVAARHIQNLGPATVIIKKGEHGCLLFGKDGQIFAAPAIPLDRVIDPTGAGDTFAGGFMGYIADKGNSDWATLKQAVVHGTVLASFACESFGPDSLATIGKDDINKRIQLFSELTHFTS